jgi:acyl-CoA thioester hydrolase
LLVKMYVSDAARTTFETWATMERLDQPGVIHAAGGATVIWVDSPAQKAKSLPDHVRKIVSGLD